MIYALPAQVVINEIIDHPPQAEQTVEPNAEKFIEFYNIGASAVSLIGWSWEAGVRFDFPTLALPAGGCVVVAADPLVSFSAASFPEVTVPVLGSWGGRRGGSERCRGHQAAGSLCPLELCRSPTSQIR